MPDLLTIYVDDQSMIEYRRTIPLPPNQLDYLDKMDQQMASGFAIGDDWIADPDQNQRAQYVASMLIQAILAENESATAAMTAYLATRLPEMSQVRASLLPEGVSIHLVFGEEAGEQIEVAFNPDLSTNLH